MAPANQNVFFCKKIIKKLLYQGQKSFTYSNNKFKAVHTYTRLNVIMPILTKKKKKKEDLWI